MTITDIGPRPQSFDLETETLENPNYRTVAWSGTYLQVTLMSIPVDGDIGLEKHPATDQFILLDVALGADPLHVLLHTGAGLGCLLAGALLEGLGMWWAMRIVRGAETA